MHIWAGTDWKVYETKIYISNIIFACFINLPIPIQNSYKKYKKMNSKLPNQGAIHKKRWNILGGLGVSNSDVARY